MPSIIEIVTNKESTKGRTVTIGGQNVRLKRPQVPVTKANSDLLQFLDAVSLAEKYTELSPDETSQLLLTYAESKNFSRNQLMQVMPALTGATAKKLIDWGIIYVFTP